MHIVFRTDASATIGHGHVMRCLTLANALHERGEVVSFICREHLDHLCKLIEERGFAVSHLPAPQEGIRFEHSSVYEASLGVFWQEDVVQTRAVIEALDAKPDWLVIDHYAIDQRWEGAMRASVGRIMVIDDLANRPHDCDLLLDQNLVAGMRARYEGKVPAACGELLGQEYALLQPAFTELHNQISPREGWIRRIFIFFSGADVDDLTGRALAAFLQLGRPDIEVDVIITSGNSHECTIRRQVAMHDNIHLHVDLPSLAPLMAAADLAIGAGGVTTWERLCMGLPSLVVTLSENQRPIAEEMQKRGLIRWLGHHDRVTASIISQALDELLQRALDEDWSRRCIETVDGKGVNRVCAAMTVTAATPLRARLARSEDEALLLTWANDPSTRANAFSQDLISAATHQAWFRKRLYDRSECRIYIIETTDNIPLGQARFERQGRVWEVDYALAPVFRGRGLGRYILEAALSELRSEITSSLIIGRVKCSNHPSRRVFESLGFELQPNVWKNTVTYRLEI